MHREERARCIERREGEKGGRGRGREEGEGKRRERENMDGGGRAESTTRSEVEGIKDGGREGEGG